MKHGPELRAAPGTLLKRVAVHLKASRASLKQPRSADQSLGEFDLDQQMFPRCEVKTAFKYVRSLINNHFSYFELSGKAGSRTMKGTFCILTLQYKRCVATINIQF